MPAKPQGLVVFAHGSGSSRHSPRNQFVARVLQDAGLGTLLFDLLTPQEAASDALTGRLRFNIPLLAMRVVNALDWVKKDIKAEKLRIGCFGASTGAAAALVAAAARPDIVQAVVSRGGRPDLAGYALCQVHAPTLLLVGGEDRHVTELNREAMIHLTASENKLRIIEGASHLFEEPGTLEAAARLTADWFVKYLSPPATKFPAEQKRESVLHGRMS